MTHLEEFSYGRNLYVLGNMKSNIRSYLKGSTAVPTGDAVAPPSPEKLSEHGKRQLRFHPCLHVFFMFMYL